MGCLVTSLRSHDLTVLKQLYYHRDSRQEFEKVGGIFPILHVVFLLDASN